MTLLIYLAKGAPGKAFIMILVGLVLGTVGIDKITGVARFDFGSAYLLGGIDFIPLAMGLFGISEVLDNLEETGGRTIFKSKMKNILPNLEDWKRSIGPILRGTVIGFLGGVLPGGGPVMEKKIRIFCIVTIVTVLTFMLSSLAVAAAKYPSEPINNVCLFGPGDQADVFNRLLSRHFEKSLGVPVITVNKPSGGGAVGFSYLAGCKPDGYTIGVGTLENMIVPTLTEGKPPYQAEDLYILDQVATIYNVLVVPANSPWKTFQEFVDYARKNPGVKFGSLGIRSTVYLRMETLNKNAKLGLIGVPFDSSAEATSAVMGGHVPVGIWDLGSARAQQAAGKVRILFIFESPVSAGLDPKTSWMGTLDKNISEKDVDISHCLVVLSKTPDEIKRVLKGTLEKVVKDPEYLADLKKMELMPNYVDGNIIMEKKRSARIEQVKAFYKEMGWLK